MSVRLRRRRGGRGFTIIELLVVLVVIAILVAIAIPMLLVGLKRAKISSGVAHVREIQLAFDQYHLDNDRYPYQDELNRRSLVPLYPDYLRSTDGLLDRFDDHEIHAYEGPTPANPDPFRWYVFLSARTTEDEANRFRIEVDGGKIKLVHRGQELSVEEALRRADDLL